MNITWLGHASFLIESGGLRIITDPYEPEDLNLLPVTESADIVVRSSVDDIAHCYTDSIPKPFETITATDIVDDGALVKGIEFSAVESQESIYKEGGSRDNAMYRFTLEGINITHMGDVGNPLTANQLGALQGTDLLFVLAGGHPTIDLDDLEEVIRVLEPKMVVPMHFRVPGPRFFMLPVTDFTDRYPESLVRLSRESSFSVVSAELLSLKETPQIVVLDPLRVKPEERPS
jgi:L-ascorbate metabolism protein UlaG (beta-lactamase superfamily)